MSKKSCFRASFEKWHGKRAEKVLKSERQHLYHIYWSLWKQFRMKKSVWVICKFFGLFGNPMTADNKYSLLNRDNLYQHFQIQLSQKRKIFSQFYFPFSRFRFRFEHFRKKDDRLGWCIFELMDSQKRG